MPAGLANLNLKGVSCARDGKHCATDGSICPLGGCGGIIPAGVLTTTNAGATWRKRSLPANVGNIGPVSCGSATLCVAPVEKGRIGPHVISGFLVTSTGGASWKVVASPGNFLPQDVSCPGGTTCFATSSDDSGGAIDKTTDGGTHWTSSSVAASGPTAISCWSPSRCVAVADGGADFLYTTNGGSSWHVAAAPGAPRLAAIACGSQSACFAAGLNSAGTVAVVLATKNGGVSWTTQTLPSGPETVGGIACSSATRCVVAGYSGTSRVIVATTDGGSHWTRQSVPAGSGDLNAVWCSAKSYCIAVGQFVKLSNGTVTSKGPYIIAS